MWTIETRARHDRSKLRYPSDQTDDEWSLIAPLIPPAKRDGRKRQKEERELVNGIMYVLSTGCQWRYVPKDLPPRSTLHDYLDRWSYDGTLKKIHHTLYMLYQPPRHLTLGCFQRWRSLIRLSLAAIRGFGGGHGHGDHDHQSCALIVFVAPALGEDEICCGGAAAFGVGVATGRPVADRGGIAVRDAAPDLARLGAPLQRRGRCRPGVAGWPWACAAAQRRADGSAQGAGCGRPEP